MIRISKLPVILLISCFYASNLEAQSIFEPQVICNGFCSADSILFFSEVKSGDCLAKNSEDSLGLHQIKFKNSQAIPDELLTVFYYYPELAHLKIQVSSKAIKQTMNCRPSPLNIFRTKPNRRYNLIINNNKGKYIGLKFNELSFNIKVGWLGHELAHICEYEKMSTMQTIRFALKYVGSKEYVRMVERNTDLITIKHGLAYPLYDGTDFLLRNKEISAKYREYAITNGLSLSEIKCFWCSLPTVNE
jgi:hypothetical protein